MKRAWINFLSGILLLIPWAALAQTPPQSGVYTFQGQGNLPAILTTLANPALNDIAIGNGQNGYSLVIPGGDLSPTGTLGNYAVAGLHLHIQTCATSPCSVTAAIVQCDAASGPITLNLPGAGGTGYWTWIQKTDATSNACLITPAGSDTINGAAGSLSLLTQSISLILDDAATGNWLATAPAVPGSIVGQGTFPLTTSANFNNFSGNNINQLVFGALTPPAGVGASSTCSGTCATLYTYEVTCLGDQGTTLPSAQVTATNAATLSNSNYVGVNWTAQPGCHGGYDVFGRLSGSLGLLATVATNSYTDTGTATPGAAPPTTPTVDAIVTAAPEVVNTNVANPGLIVSAPSGQTADLLDLNVAGAPLFRVNAAGGLDAPGGTFSGTLTGNDTTVLAPASDVVPLTVNSSASADTSDLFDLKAAGTLLAHFDHAGNLDDPTVTSTTGNLIAAQAKATAPAAPTVTVVGATGSQSYTYGVVCHNLNGASLLGATTTITNGYLPLSSTNKNEIVYACPTGATPPYTSADVVSLNYFGSFLSQASSAVTTGAAISGTVYDTGAGTAYTLPGANGTGGGLSIQGAFTATEWPPMQVYERWTSNAFTTVGTSPTEVISGAAFTSPPFASRAVICYRIFGHESTGETTEAWVELGGLQFGNTTLPGVAVGSVVGATSMNSCAMVPYLVAPNTAFPAPGVYAVVGAGSGDWGEGSAIEGQVSELTLEFIRAN